MENSQKIKLATMLDSMLNKKDARGLIIKATYISPGSGLVVRTGERMIGNFRIEESIADGIGVSFWSGYKIFDRNTEKLLAEESMKGVYYEKNAVRNKMMEVLFREFYKMAERQKIKIPHEEVLQKLEQLTNESYYADSDAILMQVLADWGIVPIKTDCPRLNS